MDDLLNTLPPEIVLQIIDYLPPSTTAHLTRLSKTWHSFIDSAHQDRIYSHPSKVDRPLTTTTSKSHTFSSLTHPQSCFTTYYHSTTSWKDLCRRQTLLHKNYNNTTQPPTTRESIYQIDISQVWRFRPDFKRRFIISTSELGGVHVTDMDSGEELWGDEMVREFAHLEYDMETGTAVWDAFGDILEVWRVDENEEDGQRGKFKRVKVLKHDCQTRGFQIGHGHLSVVSSQGKAFVYDIHPAVKKKLDLEIAPRAIGHLCQNEEVVMFSMGERGYHIHSKETGKLLGVLNPARCPNSGHVQHLELSDFCLRDPSMIMCPTVPPFPPQDPRTDRVALNHIESGSHPEQPNCRLDRDEWGAGLLDGDVMAGVSRAGRVFICSNWRETISSEDAYETTTSIVECETSSRSFDLGGWLTLRNGKVAIEVDDCVYLMNVDVDVSGEKRSPVWAVRTGSSRQSRAPVSFMAIWDDCFMYTYVTYCPLPGLDANIMTPVKTIRVLSFAPDLE
ncbi:hypothetical protein FQN54_000884 [Arachnomyces sp. PD_36]|nr:hypothetical protein FQN54_000884 [Arachnomyces sp. PD_36]